MPAEWTKISTAVSVSLTLSVLYVHPRNGHLGFGIIVLTERVRGSWGLLFGDSVVFRRRFVVLMAYDKLVSCRWSFRCYLSPLLIVFSS